MRHDGAYARVDFFHKVALVFLLPNFGQANHRRMLRINNVDSIFLKWRMPGKRTAYHHFEPSPTPFGAYCRMDAHESTSGFYVFPESQSLIMGVKHIVVGAGDQLAANDLAKHPGGCGRHSSGFGR